jgi:hypothetical protein
MRTLVGLAAGIGLTVVVAACGADSRPDRPQARRAATTPTTAVPARPIERGEPVEAATPSPPAYAKTDLDLLGSPPAVLRRRGTAPDDRADQVDLAAFVPSGARVRRVWHIDGHQVLVEWVPEELKVLTDVPLRWGLTLAVRLPRGDNEYAGRWRGSLDPVQADPPTRHNLRVSFADVTGDRVDDVFVKQSPGNHDCGPQQVFTTRRASGRALRIYSANQCETEVTGRDGLLHIRAPHPSRGDSVCCPSAERLVTRRWSGTSYETVSDEIRRTGRPEP